jgi:hypothetical protein
VTTQKKTAGDAGELVLAPSADEPPSIEDLDSIAGNLVEEARAKGIALTGQGGLLPALVGRVLETGLQAELTDHVGYEPHALEGRGSGNSRNGSFAKTLTTEIGEVPIRVPGIANAPSTRSSCRTTRVGSMGSEAQVISL